MILKRDYTYQHTLIACFLGYIVQAIVNNFAPLLFLTFHSTYGIPMSKITFLVTFNFALQMLIDILSAGFIDKIGYRAAAIIAQLFSASGFLCLAILPDIMRDPFIGLLIAVLIYAIGGGLLEVLVSPIVEACPSDNKEMTMSMLHSFYCWGHVGVVLLSTIFFALFGISHWKILALLWMIIPFTDLFLFAKAPINHLVAEDEESLKLRDLVKNSMFWILLLMMLCAGASEQGISQWASMLAEAGLGVTKTMGDIMGPMFFAVMMGIARVVYGKFGATMDLHKFMKYSTIACVGSYLLIALSPIPFLSLIGCGISGFSVGIMWPGTFSLAAANMKKGGTILFAILALAGDVGCSAGPTVIGLASSILSDNLKMGILCGIIFPLLMLLGLFLQRSKN